MQDDERSTMRLSEAIRLGSMLRPQVFGRYEGYTTPVSSVKETYTAVIGTCAMGAAFEARFGTAQPNLHPMELLEWPVLDLTWIVGCPVKGCLGVLTLDIAGLIPHLNDVHRWSRERIADLVGELERRAQAQSLTGNHTGEPMPDPLPEPEPEHEPLLVGVEG